MVRRYRKLELLPTSLPDSPYYFKQTAPSYRYSDDMTKRVISANQLSTKLLKAYPALYIIETTKDRILIAAEESPEDKDEWRIFHYWIVDYKEKYYVMGIRKHLFNFLERNGWYGEWVNSGTIALYKA